MKNGRGKQIFTIKIFDCGDFGLFDPETDEEFDDIIKTDKEFFEALREAKLSGRGVANELITFIQTNSGYAIIGGRRIRIPNGT